MVNDNDLSLQYDNGVKVFANKYIISEKQVITAVKHTCIHDLRIAANLRSKERKRKTKLRKENKFAYYDWQKLVGERKLDDLFVYELDIINCN